MTQPPSPIYEFGDFRVDTSRRLVSRGGKAVPLTAKAFDTLLYLVEHQGVVLDKDELMKALWPHTVVEENNLNQSISALRRVLGESRGENRYVVTVPGRGYQFVAAVTKVQASQPDAEPESPISAPSSRPPDHGRYSARLIVLVALSAMALGLALYYLGRDRTAAVATSNVRSLAVLPFKPLRESGRDESLELGMTDALIVRLGTLRDMRVSPLSSVRRFGGLEQDPLAAGRALGVEAVLDGQIHREGDRIGVSARLLSVGDGRQLWADQFNDQFSDVFTVQDSISRRVIDALALQLTGEDDRRLTQRDTKDAGAYEHYLHGRFRWELRTHEGLKKAVEEFGAAIERDQKYALAYAGLADAYSLLGVLHVRPKDAFPLARDAALKALSIDSNLAEAHAALGHIKVQYEHDWAGAVTDYRRAIQLKPTYANAHLFYALCLTQLGRFDDGLRAIRRAQELESSLPFVSANAGHVLYQARRYNEAVTQLTHLVEEYPRIDLGHSLLGHAYLQQGSFEKAVAEYQKQTVHPGRFGDLGYAYAVAGKTEEAFKELAGLQKLARERYVAPFHRAVIYAGLGDKANALAGLEHAYEDHSTLLVWIKVDPRLDGLRSEPRFQVILERMGLQ